MIRRTFALPATADHPGHVVDLPRHIGMPHPTFNARIVDVHDGDTIRVDIMLGMGVTLSARRVRFAGCNAAELHTEAGDAAAAAVRELLPTGAPITVQIISLDADPHGRPLVAVALDDGTNLVEHLIAEQWAAPWDGRGTPPVPVWPRTVAEPA